MRTIVVGCLTAVLLATSIACTHVRHIADAPDPSAPEMIEATSVQVENRNWQDVVIYAFHDGTHTRLGTVNAAATLTFKLADNIVIKNGDLRFVAHAIGERRMFMSEPVILLSGQTALWTLESGLERSSLSVR